MPFTIHRESRRHNFRRTFELDLSIDTARISAKIEQGVVTLTLPKAEQVKPRKIAVSHVASASLGAPKPWRRRLPMRHRLASGS
jgi:hypothetical protein